MKYNFQDAKSGDVLLWKGKDIMAEIIEHFSDGFSHASLFVTFGEYPEKWFSMEAVGSGGIVLTPFPKAYNDHGECWLYPLRDEYSDKRVEIVSWGLDHLGVGYDFWSVAQNIFGHVAPDVNRMFCSEFVILDWYYNAIIGKPSVAYRPGEIPSLNRTKEGGLLK
jgi:hypothetical protein